MQRPVGPAVQACSAEQRRLERQAVAQLRIALQVRGDALGDRRDAFELGLDLATEPVGFFVPDRHVHGGGLVQLVELLLERRDLRFQIAALKQKLDQLNQASTVDMAVWHEETHRLSCEIQAKLESIAPIARRIASDLQRYPELRDRLPLEPALLC